MAPPGKGPGMLVPAPLTPGALPLDLRYPKLKSNSHVRIDILANRYFHVEPVIKVIHVVGL